MRNFILSLVIALAIVMPTNNVQAQNSGGAAVGALIGAAAIGAAGAIAANEQYKEALELEATQYVLSKYDIEKFKLSAFSSSDNKKGKDQSAVSIASFKFFDFDNNKRYVLLGLLSRGWVNENGVDYSKITWERLDLEEWMKMAKVYVDRASDRDIDVSLLTNGKIVNTGVKSGSKTIVTFINDGNDVYKVANYSDKYKIVFNEKSFGLYLRATRDLVQLRRKTVIEIHDYLLARTGK